MAEARQVVKDMNLWRVRHDVTDGVARLGSLDFLSTSPSRGNAARLGLFDDEKPSIRRVTGTGEVEDSRVGMPPKCHLVIANPPYTRAGGPGDEKNTRWNPIFGSLLDKRDAEKMKKALRKALDGTAGSLYAGLGSAFVVLADEALDIGGRMAFVLPATMLTGSRWAPIRRLLLSKYAVEWVVVSHDSRNRSAKKGLPGRRLVSFSESTRIAEVLIVATKRPPGELKESRACFVNLLRNPDEPIEALGLTRKLLALRDGLAPLEPTAIDIGDTTWGNAILVPQEDLPLDGGPWSLATFVQPGLAQVAKRIASGKYAALGSVPIANLGAFADLGPYHMQVKNPKYGLFTVREQPMAAAPAEWKLRAGVPVLWHHKAVRNTCLAASADALLERRADRSRSDQDRMLARSGRLHLAADLGMAPQRVAAVMTDNPMLGISSWVSVVPRSPGTGQERSPVPVAQLHLRAPPANHARQPALPRPLGRAPRARPHHARARRGPPVERPAGRRHHRIRRSQESRASGLHRAGHRSRPARAQRASLPRGARYRSRDRGRRHPQAGAGAYTARAALEGRVPSPAQPLGGGALADPARPPHAPSRYVRSRSTS